MIIQGTCGEVIDIDDFAVLGSCRLDNEPTRDIAPPGGDCIINLLDLAALVDNWLDITGT